MYFVFISSYILIYSGMHLYFYTGLRHIPFFGEMPGVFIYLFFSGVMVMAPVISRLLEAYSLFWQKFFAWNGYIWMGILFLTVSCMFSLDLLRLLWSVFSRISGFKGHFSISVRSGFLLSLSLALVLSLYGFSEAGKIKIEHIQFESSLIPENIDRLRIVQVSDLHLGLIEGISRAKSVASYIRSLNPDIIVSTGDFVDGQMGEMDGVSGIFYGLRAPLGKYAVTGNHEFYSGIGQAVSFTENCGFTVLRNSHEKVNGFLVIAGVDDPAVNQYGGANLKKEAEILKDLSAKTLRVLLKHQPVVENESIGAMDLQLSGHTHGGQIFPFSLLTRLVYPLRTGLSHAKKGSWVYHSRGTGTWGPPARLLSPPEITAIDIVKSREGSRFRPIATQAIGKN